MSDTVNKAAAVGTLNVKNIIRRMTIYVRDVRSQKIPIDDKSLRLDTEASMTPNKISLGRYTTKLKIAEELKLPVTNPNMVPARLITHKKGMKIKAIFFENLNFRLQAYVRPANK